MDNYKSRLAAGEDPGMVIGGSVVFGADTIQVTNSFAGKPVGRISLGSSVDVSDAVEASVAAQSVSFPAHKRYDVLMRAADLVEADAGLYVSDLANEGHKSVREAAAEPARAASVLRMAAEEARRLKGETLPFDIKPGSERRVGYYTRVPVGVVGAILPFNDPLTVAAHKIGPALAGGNSCVVKPDSRSALTVLRLVHQFLDAGAPPGILNCITGYGSVVGDALVRDPRVRLIAFTGGFRTGEKIARAAGIKKTVLELGSNSAVIVLSDADLSKAARAICAGAYGQAGQNCLGVQRILVETPVYDNFLDEFVPLVKALRTGSSLDIDTDVCPLVTVKEALRVEAMIADAIDKGATVLAGGDRIGAVVTPTILADVPSGAALQTEEAYGPVVIVTRVDSLDEAIAISNAVDFGLHAAIFTTRIQPAFDAARRLDVGGVIVNDSTDYRLDSMPFGGVKNSGIGREGLRFAVEEMTETRVVCFNLD